MNNKIVGLKTVSLALGCAMGLFASCSSEDNVAIINNVPEAARGEVIKLSAACPAVTTRGVGSVGDLEESEKNVWMGNPLHIYAIAKDADDFTYPFQDTDHYVPTILLGGERDEYQGQLGYAPYEANEGDINLFSGSQSAMCYYPLVGTYRFMGFHIDDAEVKSARVSDKRSSIDVEVEFDGSQDIMTAYDPKDYTTRTAREGKKPNLVFNHELTRLVFYIVAGEQYAIDTGVEYVPSTEERLQEIKAAEAADSDFIRRQGVLMEDICLIGQYNRGVLRVSCGGVSWLPKTDSQADLKAVIEEKKGSPAVDEPVAVGELLVNPEINYLATFTMAEYLDKDGAVVKEDARKKVYSNIRIAPPSGENEFKAGTSYDVKITVYSMEPIEVTASLTGWKSGGEVNLIPDD